MNKKELNKRILSALHDVYDEAESAFPRRFSFEEIEDIMAKVPGSSKEKQFPWRAFYLSNDRQKEIIQKYTKYTRGSWRWPRRSQIGKDGKVVPDPEWDQHYADYTKMTDLLERKVITRKEFNDWMNSEAVKYGMIRRNYDAEAISFNVYNFGPNINPESFSDLRTLFSAAYEKWKADNTLTEFIGEDDVPMVTDADVEAKIEINKKAIEKNAKDMPDWNPDEEFLRHFTDPEEIRSELVSSRTAKINRINYELSQMIIFWEAAQK